MFNKKLIAIIAIAILVVFLGVGAFMYFSHNQNGGLPVVGENQTTQATKDFSSVQLPAADDANQDNLINESEDSISQQELSKEVAIEKERGDIVNVETPDSVAAENKKIEDARKEAATDPDVQKIDEQPIEVTPPTPEPSRDANGFIYTKEEAIKTFATEFQKLINSGDYNYTSALEEAKGREGFTQESFDADLKTLMTDPYSSQRLAIAFDGYRQNGDFDTLLVKASLWLSMGGDDGPWVDAVTY